MIKIHLNLQKVKFEFFRNVFVGERLSKTKDDYHFSGAGSFFSYNELIDHIL